MNTLSLRWLLALISVAYLSTSAANADITNFPFPNYTINRADSASLPTVTPDTIQLTSISATNQSRSIFYDTPQNITQFTATFTFRSNKGTPGGIGANSGTTFVLHNSSAGLATVTTSTTDFGYGQIPAKFDHSVAVSLENHSIALNSSSTALYTNGVVGAGSANTTPLDLFSGNSINVALSYDGSILHEKLTDTVTLVSKDWFYPINIPSVVGNSSAYVGFTAGVGFSHNDQFISNFRFTNAVPEPPAGILLCLGALGPLIRAGRSNRKR